jgi:hypothetical protein
MKFRTSTRWTKLFVGLLEPPISERVHLVLLDEGVKLLADSLKKHPVIWSFESESSIFKKIPLPFALFHDVMVPFDVMRALIAHRFWYGFRLPID